MADLGVMMAAKQELTVLSVGEPANLTGLARLLLKVGRTPALHLVDDEPRCALSPVQQGPL